MHVSVADSMRSSTLVLHVMLPLCCTASRKRYWTSSSQATKECMVIPDVSQLGAGVNSMPLALGHDDTVVLLLVSVARRNDRSDLRLHVGVGGAHFLATAAVQSVENPLACPALAM